MRRGLLPELNAIAMRSSAGTVAGGAKRGLKPPDREHEARTFAEPGAQRRRAGDRELVREARINEHGIDRRGALIEIDDAHRLHVEAHEIVVCAMAAGR